MNVLISGAGIAGPVLAFFLARTGARVTIIEKSHYLLTQGQNIDMQGSAVGVARRMGVLDEILRANTGEKGTQFIAANGKPFAPFPVKEGFSVTPTSQYEVLRGDLADILYRASRDHPHVKYLFDTTITTVISNNDDSVTVELNNGQRHSFDLLVAADGQWSKTRKVCFPTDAIEVVDKGMYASYWTIPRVSSDNNLWNIYITQDSKLLAIRPDSHGTTRVMVTRMPQNELQTKEWQKASRSNKSVKHELLKREFGNAGWQAQRFLQGLDNASDFYFQAIQQIKMSKWSIGRVICLGDAAYAPTPITGSGTSLAINGAYVLAGELSKLSVGEHPSRAFDSYERIYRPFVEKTQNIPSFVPSVMHPAKVWKRWILQAFISMLSIIISGFTSIPWLAGRYDVVNQEDFPLPHYAAFEDMHQTEIKPVLL